MEYDLVIIGGGPAGYVAALTARRYGLSTLLIEDKEVGGTCLYEGCIPVKTLITSASFYERSKKPPFGISCKAELDFASMQSGKEQTIHSLSNSLLRLLKAHGVELLKGEGAFLSPTQIAVGNKKITAKNFLIATGSTATSLPCLAVDGKQIHNSSTVLQIKKLPLSIAIVGGGSIGCEFAYLFSALGVKVSLIECLPKLLPYMPSFIGKEMAKIFQKRGIDLYLNEKVISLEGTTLFLEDKTKLSSELILVATGRKPLLPPGIEKTGIHLIKNAISVNESFQTNVSTIYAAGDVTSKWMLAHAAAEEGLIAVMHMAGKKTPPFPQIPAVIYTKPEAASVGLWEENAGKKILTGTYPLHALSKAKVDQDLEGSFQIIADSASHKILGAHVISNSASTLIQELILAVQKELTLEDLETTVHPHPSLSEGWKEAALIALNRPLHL